METIIIRILIGITLYKFISPVVGDMVDKFFDLKNCIIFTMSLFLGTLMFNTDKIIDYVGSPIYGYVILVIISSLYTRFLLLRFNGDLECKYCKNRKE